jgi:protein TonB
VKNPSVVDRLDEHIESMVTHADGVMPAFDGELRDLLAIAGVLQTLPDQTFKARLKCALINQGKQSAIDVELAASAISPHQRGETRRPSTPPTPSEILPTLFAKDYGVYPVHRGSFLASALAHAAVLALLVTVGIFAARNPRDVPRVHSVIKTDLSSYLFPTAPTQTHGGGGGGDHDKAQASNGAPPRFAPDQITPPAIVVRNENAKLTADPTVVGPPNLTLAETRPMGDPLSGVLGSASNGTGAHGGVGNGSDGGVGPGRGPGVGPGTGGGFGGEPYHVGGRVSSPRAVYDPEPEYSEEARRSKYQGVVVLRVVIGPDGRPQDIRVARTLGMGLDEKAMEAVRQWRFQPALMDNQPVPVLVDIEINFRLY